MIKQPVENIILDIASRKNQIVYGQQAVNRQIPTYLKKKTKDYDILTKNPKAAAEELVRRLKQQNGDYEIKKAIYKRTWKVKDKKTGETIADYTQPSRYPKTKTILGVKYADTEYSKRKILKTLRNEFAKYRWEKDKDVLQRIKKGEQKIW